PYTTLFRSAVADLDVTVVRDVDELGEVGVEHVARQILVPFRMREESRNANLRRVVERLARAPVLAAVLLHAVRRAQRRRVLLRRRGIARERRLGPGLEPTRRNQVGLLVLGHALEPPVLRRSDRHLAVGAERAARVGERGGGAYPSRRVEHEL